MESIKLKNLYTRVEISGCFGTAGAGYYGLEAGAGTVRARRAIRYIKARLVANSEV